LCYVTKRCCVMLPIVFVLCGHENLCYVAKRVCVKWPREFV